MTAPVAGFVASKVRPVAAGPHAPSMNNVGTAVGPPRSGAPILGPVERRPLLGCLVEVVETLVLTLIIFLVIQNFVAQPYQVQQRSMEQTLEPGQYVLVDKLTPRWDAYSRGDVVVFTPPAEANRGTTPFIKRVLGLPGDTVEIVVGGLVAVNGVTLQEPYLYAGSDGQLEPTTSNREQRWVVPAGELFVMGDHRQESVDSRRFGTVEIGNVLGRAVLRYWPLGSAGVVQVPTYEGVPAP